MRLADGLQGRHSSRAHAPNESIRIADYFEGMLFIRELIERFARMKNF